jgi:hypothetical protein
MASTVGHTYSRKCKPPHFSAVIPVLTPFSVNIKMGPPGDRSMTTGLHTVRDIYCIRCGETLGWKYVSSPQPVLPLCA